MTPWEERSDLMSTVKGVLLEPTTLYRSVEKQGPIGRAVAYGVLLGTLGVVLGLAWQLVGTGLFDLAGLRQQSDLEEHLLPVSRKTFLIILTALSPLFMILSLFVSAGMQHLGLMVLGGARYGFDATVRAAAYAQTAQLASVIPLCGGVIAPIWVLVLTVIGLREIHETTTGKAAAAILLPFVVCCGFVALAIVVPLWLRAR